MSAASDPLDFASLRRAYDGGAKPWEVMTRVLERMAEAGDDHIWIVKREAEAILADAKALPDAPNSLPLYGIPFAVKDNMDVAGYPTTAACPAYAYLPQDSTPLVPRLIAAGAILIGKTNMDQFATGLVGIRSPYGVPRNPYDPELIPGGSSAGSAAAVGAGLVSFALGSDTGGSGRVPAAFNNVVGFKPTLGAASMRGIVPACRSLDCPAIFTSYVKDALQVADIIYGYDDLDPYSRLAPPGFSLHQNQPSGPFVFAVPKREHRQFFGDHEAEVGFDRAIARMVALGGTPHEVDFTPFVAIGDLFYQIWLAERVADLGPFIAAHQDEVHPVVYAMLDKAAKVDGVSVFKAKHRLTEVMRLCDRMWAEVAFMLVPTTGTAYSIDQVLEQPLERNGHMGYYANFANLLDMAAVAVPNGFKSRGVPQGVTLLGPAWSEGLIAAYGSSFVALDPKIG